MTYAEESPLEWSTKQNNALVLYTQVIIGLPRVVWKWAIARTQPQDLWKIYDKGASDLDHDMRISLSEAWNSTQSRMNKAADAIYGTHPKRSLPSPIEGVSEYDLQREILSERSLIPCLAMIKILYLGLRIKSRSRWDDLAGVAAVQPYPAHLRGPRLEVSSEEIVERIEAEKRRKAQDDRRIAQEKAQARAVRVELAEARRQEARDRAKAKRRERAETVERQAKHVLQSTNRRSARLSGAKRT